MEKVKIGVIGCGTIAQIMHIPHLREMEEYELRAVCDISPKLVQKVGDYYNIRKRYTDFRELLHSDIDAVLVSTSFDHAEICIEAAKAGKHILVEKPMCINLREANEMIEAAKRNNVKLMVAYMKRYDPGYLYAQKLISQMKEIKLIRLHDVIGPNEAFINDICTIIRYDDIPKNFEYEAKKKYLAAIKEAIGDVPDYIRTAYSLMLGLSVHDITILRGLFGNPTKILFTEIWDKGMFYTSVMDYGSETKCIFDTGIMGIKKFDEELAVFSKNKVIKINFPSPFFKNAPTYVSVWEMEDGNYVEKQVLASYRESFKQELIHFYDCIVNDKKPLTNGEEGRKDLELLLKMIKATK